MPCREGGRGARRDLLVVKIGGSVATYRDKSFAPRLQVLERLAAVFNNALRNGYRLLLVIGGGSYGHVAVEASREAGAGPGETISVVSNAMYELALTVSDILVSRGVYTYIFPPHAFCEPEGVKPNCEWRLVEKALSEGLTPLLFGDIYPSERGYGIVSGDDLVVEAACRLGATKAVFLTNVDGVYSSIDERRVIEVLDKDALASMLSGDAGLGAGEWPDVTGGMRRKLESILVNGCPNLRIVVTNGFRIGSLYDLLRERGWDRTLILL